MNGTPTAFVNGVKLDSCPTTVDGWLDFLDSTYNSQYSVAFPTATPKFPQN